MNEHKPRDKSHKTDSMVITCMDHRFQRDIRDRLAEDYRVDIGESDRLAYAGASRAVSDGTLIPQIELAYKLHGIKNVYIVDHIDCGGFGGLAAHDNDEQKELAAHMRSMKQARDAIHKLLPRLEVTCFVINLDGEAVPLVTDGPAA